MAMEMEMEMEKDTGKETGKNKAIFIFLYKKSTFALQNW